MRLPHPTVDAPTLAAARAGRREAQAALLRDLQDPWYRTCVGLLGNPEQARDATQETALRFLRQLPGFRGDSQLRTWSLGIALNVVREMRRKHGRERSVGAGGFDDVDPADGSPLRAGAASPSPTLAAEASETRDVLRATLDELPPRQREAVLLRFFEDLSVDETAAAMGCATGTVKATVHQALRSLRDRLKQLA